MLSLFYFNIQLRSNLSLFWGFHIEHKYENVLLELIVLQNGEMNLLVSYEEWNQDHRRNTERDVWLEFITVTIRLHEAALIHVAESYADTGSRNCLDVHSCEYRGECNTTQSVWKLLTADQEILNLGVAAKHLIRFGIRSVRNPDYPTFYSAADEEMSSF